MNLHPDLFTRHNRRPENEKPDGYAIQGRMRCALNTAKQWLQPDKYERVHLGHMLAYFDYLGITPEELRDMRIGDVFCIMED